MTAPLQILFLDSPCLGKPQSVEQVMEVFVRAGFQIHNLKAHGRSVPWAEYARRPTETMALAYCAKELSFRALNHVWRLEVTQQLGWGTAILGAENRAWIGTVTDNTPYFWHAETDPAGYSGLLLDIGRSLYDILRPTFGWVDFDYGLFTTHEDIEALSLPMLYWANFFGPVYVRKIGRDKILSAPAWRIEELCDGGLLYVLASCPGLANDHVSVDAVKAHFGVSRVR